MTTAEQLAALRASFDAFVEQYRQETGRASEEREKTLQAVAKLAQEQSQLLRDMAEVKPVTDMVSGFRARVMGGLMVLGVIGAIIWAGVQFFKEQIIRLLSA